MQRMLRMLLFVFISLLTACSTKQVKVADESVLLEGLYSSAQQLTDVMVFDIFSPPQASRVYAYAHMAAYEAAHYHDSSWMALIPQLNGEQSVPAPTEFVDGRLAAVVALQEVSIAMLYSYGKMEDWQLLWLDSIQPLYDASTWASSLRFGEQVAQSILAYANKDGFNKIRALPRYVVTHNEGQWKPTPPGYMDAIEPNWHRLRSFTLSQSDQFKPASPTPYSKDHGSRFYDEMLEVYDVVNELTPAQKDIASFWDCNPYVAYTQGHFMMGNKKITPGGHWMGIAQIACKESNKSFVAATGILAHTAIALADGFISCWDEKYRSNYIRPETAINQMHDPQWQPLLQTPPFPEYTSGHSVISTAAATVLTAYFGPSFDYDDTVEVPFGLPVRHYTSFLTAAEEAAISRLYGGIHFRPAIENGVQQGRAVGEWVVGQIQLKQL